MVSLETITRVWWVYPPDDGYQHATLECPPRDGGDVRTLAGATVSAPPRGWINLHPHRPFCDSCLVRYVCTPTPIPSWAY